MTSKKSKALVQEGSTDIGSPSTGSKLGLTPEGRVDLDQIVGSVSFTHRMRIIAKSNAPFSRPLDWKDGPRNLMGLSQIHAAIGQENGTIAPEGKECDHCRLYGGTFKSCVVFAYNLTGLPMLMYNGACMNCHIVGIRSCSFAKRRGSALPIWIQQVLETLPHHPTPSLQVSNTLTNKRKAIEHSTDSPAPKAGRKDDKPSTDTSSRTGPQYDSVWYSSPLDDPSVGSRKNYHEKRVALRSLKSAKNRIDHDIAKVAGFLTESGHINSSSDDGDDSDAENVFTGFELMKMGTEDEQEGENAEEQHEEENEKENEEENEDEEDEENERDE